MSLFGESLVHSEPWSSECWSGNTGRGGGEAWGCNIRVKDWSYFKDGWVYDSCGWHFKDIFVVCWRETKWRIPSMVQRVCCLFFGGGYPNKYLDAHTEGGKYKMLIH